METKLNYENRTEKTPADAPLICCSVRENISSMNLKNKRNTFDDSKFFFHVGSGYNSEQSEASMSGQRIFVLSETGKPLTPCKPQKARKLILGRVAVVVWNKFGQFGIKMLIQTREFTPKTILGIDNGTKFEGYSIVSDKENNVNIMWLLPNKKKLVRKLKERRQLRSTRRFRNCRRREARFNNRSRKDFIAPSQLMMVNSRLKCIKEFFKCYPISKVAFEDVKFNHRDNRWGKNFSTIEIGKTMIKNFIVEKIGRENLISFEGTETFDIRKQRGLKKGSNKSAENFNSHCVDSFVIASELVECNNPKEEIVVVDDTYRPVRRRLHDINFSKGGKRDKYSTGNFKGIRKGSICEFGQIVGGTKNTVYIRNSDNIRIGKSLSKINWFSKSFKIKQLNNSAIPPTYGKVILNLGEISNA